MSEPRVLVFAYHDVGHECFAALLERRVQVVGVFTHTDDPEERIWFKSVAQLARTQTVPVYTPGNVNAPEWIERIRALRPDLIFSFYYRHLISQRILDLARLGSYNMHGSLLPKYRGRAPVNWAVLNGETETGATLHVMTKRADAGDIVDQERVSIGSEDTAQDVFNKVTAAARRVLERQIDNLLHGTAPRLAQDETAATYFGGRRPEDGRIDWRQEARAVCNLIRAVTHPYPGAFTEIDGRRFYIWKARPASASGRPGEIIRTMPLTVAAGGGSAEVAEWQWHGDPAPHHDDTHALRANLVFDIPSVIPNNTSSPHPNPPPRAGEGTGGGGGR
jgi:methionyl-tRNA formyltransferase